MNKLKLKKKKKIIILNKDINLFNKKIELNDLINKYILLQSFYKFFIKN